MRANIGKYFGKQLLQPYLLARPSGLQKQNIIGPVQPQALEVWFYFSLGLPLKKGRRET